MDDFNPSLGLLGRLPAELRNTIYDLVINTNIDYEVSFHQPCQSYQSLLLLSKQIHFETVGLYRAAREISVRCRHVKLKFILLPPRNSPDVDWSTIPNLPYVLPSPQHIVGKHVESLKLIIQYLGKDAPKWVVCHLKHPQGFHLEIRGGDARIRLGSTRLSGPSWKST